MNRIASFVIKSTLFTALAAGTARAESWEGSYAGVHAGLADSDNVFIDVDGFLGPGPRFDGPIAVVQPGPGARFPYDGSAFAFGFHAGHDWQSGNLVAGIEADITFADAVSAIPVDLAEQDETAFTEFDYITTLRGRAGWTNGKLLLFGTAGVALGRYKNELIDFDLDANNQYTIFDTDDSFSDQQTDIGWVVGAGAEARVTDNVRLRFETQYVDFGRSRNIVNLADDALPPTSGPQRYDVENELLVFRFGLTFGF